MFKIFDKITGKEVKDVAMFNGKLIEIHDNEWNYVPHDRFINLLIVNSYSYLNNLDYMIKLTNDKEELLIFNYFGNYIIKENQNYYLIKNIKQFLEEKRKYYNYIYYKNYRESIKEIKLWVVEIVNI